MRKCNRFSQILALGPAPTWVVLHPALFRSLLRRFVCSTWPSLWVKDVTDKRGSSSFLTGVGTNLFCEEHRYCVRVRERVCVTQVIFTGIKKLIYGKPVGCRSLLRQLKVPYVYCFDSVTNSSVERWVSGLERKEVSMGPGLMGILDYLPSPL